MLEQSFESLYARCLQEWVSAAFTFKKEFQDVENFYQQRLDLFLKDFINQNGDKLVFNQVQAAVVISSDVKKDVVPVFPDFDNFIID